LYGFLYRDQLIYYQGGYDPAYLKYSTGVSLAALVMEHAICHSAREFDYFRGSEAYK
jgi:hypothetical protein